MTDDPIYDMSEEEAALMHRDPKGYAIHVNGETFQDKIKRQINIWEFERDKRKADIKFFQQPWWIQAQEEGDYHYGGYYEGEPEEEK